MSGNKTYRIEKLLECTTLDAEVAITVEDKLTDISAYTANGEIAALLFHYDGKWRKWMPVW